MTITDHRPGTTSYDDGRRWVPVCPLDRLVPGRGVAALLPDGGQVAVFLLPGGALHAVGNLDPYSGAAVLSRGLTGERAGEPTVASPLLKQVFSLRDGRALEDEGTRLPVHPVRVAGDVVVVGVEPV